MRICSRRVAALITHTWIVDRAACLKSEATTHARARPEAGKQRISGQVPLRTVVRPPVYLPCPCAFSCELVAQQNSPNAHTTHQPTASSTEIMACEIGNSPFDSGFDDNWMKSEHDNPGLSSISDFNSNFEHAGETINPSLAYSTPSTPQNSNQHAYGFNDTTANADLSQTLSPHPMYEAYPSTFNNASNTPYFSSVDLNRSAFYQPSLLRNEHHSHRRSVSEPPGTLDHSPVTFHRDDHYLGAPVRAKATALKSLPKHKSHRNHPYPVSASARKAARSRPQSHSHLQQQAEEHPSHRPGMQRAQTQPVRHYQQHAPTSAPMISPQQFTSMSPEHLQQAMNTPPPPAHMMAGSPFMQSTSRVCTPTPIDPSLSESPLPIKRMKKETMLNIPMTVDELQAMIFNTVQKAVGGNGARTNVGNVEQEQEKTEEDAAEEHLVSPKAVQIEDVEDDDADIGVFHAEE